MEYFLSHELIAGGLEDLHEAGRSVSLFLHQHTIVAAAVVLLVLFLWRWTTAPPRPR